MNNKALRFSVLLVAALLIAACGGQRQDEGEEAKQYDLLTITAGDHELTTEYAASLKGQQDIRIIPRIEGYLQGICVKEGQRVKEGQLLFRVDAATYRAAVESANANVEQMTAALEKTQLEYDGKRQLHIKNIISDYELSTAQSDLAVAKANLAAAKAALVSAQNELGYTELRSPSDGVVGRDTLPQGRLREPQPAGGTYHRCRQQRDSRLFLDERARSDGVPLLIQDDGCHRQEYA